MKDRISEEILDDYMFLFTQIALKWKQPIEYVLEKGMSVIWKVLDVLTYDPDYVDEEEVIEDMNDTLKAHREAQRRARERAKTKEGN